MSLLVHNNVYHACSREWEVPILDTCFDKWPAFSGKFIETTLEDVELWCLFRSHRKDLGDRSTLFLAVGVNIGKMFVSAVFWCLSKLSQDKLDQRIILWQAITNYEENRGLPKKPDGLGNIVRK